MNKAIAQVGGIVPEHQATLSHKDYGFTDADLEKEYYIYDHGQGFTAAKERFKLKELIGKMEEVNSKI